MRIILIGNYKPDGQESMERFAKMLANEFGKKGILINLWQPPVIMGYFVKSTTSGIGKWLGYFDKWLIFPFIIRLRSAFTTNGRTCFHICDHSNAPYLKHLPSKQTAITCHDVLAIRGALGYRDAFCDASAMGKILQKWILSNLINAKKLATVSNLTLRQLKELAGNETMARNNWQVIHNAFNAEFKKLQPSQVAQLLNNTGLSTKKPFILHVGSGLPRKNRKLLLDMVRILGRRWDGNICFAGEETDEPLNSYAASLGLSARVFSLVKPSHEILVALYSSCEAFIFPSFSEGFGWPLIEAQACGAPVIASNIDPMPEVSGGAALHADPTDAIAFANAFLALNDKAFRAALIDKGLKNSKRFSTDLMIGAYLKLHNINSTKQGTYAS